MYHRPTEDDMGLIRSKVQAFFVQMCDAGRGEDALAETANYPLNPETTIYCTAPDMPGIAGIVCWTGKNIDVLFVGACYRKRGFGSTLLAMAMQEIGEDVTLTIRPGWDKAARFVRKMGFGGERIVMRACRWVPIGKSPESVLFHLREENHLTRKELAKRVGLRPLDVEHVEEDIHSVSIGVVCTLARFYGVSAGYILTPDLELCGTQLPGPHET